MTYTHDKPESQTSEKPDTLAALDAWAETPTPETYLACDLPLWCRRVDGRFPENDEVLAEYFREARAMVDRELMEAIYVMLRQGVTLKSQPIDWNDPLGRGSTGPVKP